MICRENLPKILNISFRPIVTHTDTSKITSKTFHSNKFVQTCFLTKKQPEKVQEVLPCCKRQYYYHSPGFLFLKLTFRQFAFFQRFFCTVSLFSWLESLKNLPIVIFKCFCGENTNSVTLKNHNSFERSMLVWFRFRSLDQTSSFVQTLHYCLLAHHFVQTSHPLYTLCELHSATICCIFIHFTLMLYYVT